MSKGCSRRRSCCRRTRTLWFWYDLDYLKSRDDAKDVLTTPRNNTILTFLSRAISTSLGVPIFSPAGFYREQGRLFALTIRLPAGREGMAEDVELHLPRDAKGRRHVCRCWSRRA